MGFTLWLFATKEYFEFSMISNIEKLEINILHYIKRSIVFNRKRSILHCYRPLPVKASFDTPHRLHYSEMHNPCENKLVKSSNLSRLIRIQMMLFKSTYFQSEC